MPSLEQITAHLDQCLEVEFTFYQTAPLAEALAELPAPERAFALDWVRRVAGTHVTLGHAFADGLPRALARADTRLVEAWALHAMDTYDRAGLRPALEVMRDLERYLEHRHERAAGAVFEEAAGVLSHFAHGLSGRKLRLAQGEAVYTDTETIYLPAVVVRLPERAENFRLYKAMVAMLWAQARFGTFRVGLGEVLVRQRDPARFLALFQALETRRLEACIARELPGLHREMEAIKARLGEGRLEPRWHPLVQTLARPEATAGQALALAEAHCAELRPPPPLSYQGELRPEEAEACMAARVHKEKALLRVALQALLEEQRRRQPEREEAGRFSQREVPDPRAPEGMRIEILLDDQPVAPPEEVRGTLGSIVQDLGELPEEYLVPAGPGEYDPALFEEKTPDPDEVWQGTYHEEGAYLYKEWDYRRRAYRKNWSVLREKEVTPVYDDFVSQTLVHHHGLVKHLRRTFEAMRDEDRLLRRQPQGDEVDIDALVEALADACDGSEMSDRLFSRRHRSERHIAVAFMVDMSGSTKGWINDAEREALVLMCEALEALGDRYAIYGFSGTTRKRCELYRIKRFDEPYQTEVKARISGIRPQDYTRMGVAIRHLTDLLKQTDARTRILITLSDGKPDDYDHYRGDYGIEDTRRALIEARRDGVHPYCITIDEEARDYLPHLYGPAAFTVVDEVRQLPFRVADIYRRLTT